MKITKVELFHVTGLSSRGWNPVIVRLNTDEGLSGVGEVGLAIVLGHSAGFGMVKDLAEQFVIGADPMKNEELWETMFRKGFWTLGGGAAIYGGMSAIDQALWDIRGKALGVPVHVLLGGKMGQQLRVYASQLQFRWTEEINHEPVIRPEEYAEEALKAIGEGYTAVKVDPLMFDGSGRRDGWDLRKIIGTKDLKVIYERIKAIRSAVGPEIGILLEAHGSLSARTAIQVERILQEFNLFFYEEPVAPLNIETMLKVSQKVSVPLAAGERIYTRWGYREYFEKQAFDVVQPDLGLVGGITEGKKICDFAHIYDIMVQCHTCGSPVATACALQLEAAIPNFIIHEHVAGVLKKDIRSLVKEDLKPKNGYFHVPDKPGLGVELNDETMAPYLSVEIK